MNKHLDFDNFTISDKVKKPKIAKPVLFKSLTCDFTAKNKRLIAIHLKYHETTNRKLSCESDWDNEIYKQNDRYQSKYCEYTAKLSADVKRHDKRHEEGSTRLSCMK
ncbi:MAG: hypothetical protein INQ03_20110 [Candidatus Heimdallarchaeota archaeon]|nr:hypothetical protein [Candidatus Heimdallarchaeota archaeon]